MNSLSRISSIVVRHWYLCRSSMPRLIEIAFWPLLEVLFWGFFSQYLSQESGKAQFGIGLMVGAAFLSQVLIRNQLSMFMVFMEEVWARNFGHLVISPLRPWEYIVGVIIVAFLRLIIGLTPLAVVAWYLFSANVFAAGPAMLAFFPLLMIMGWAVGFLSIAIIMRYGLGAEWTTWIIIFVITPLICVYYPVSVLPGWLQPVALAIPATYVFEGMRTAMFHGTLDTVMLMKAFVLDLVYIAGGLALLSGAYRYARREGRLLASHE